MDWLMGKSKTKPNGKKPPIEETKPCLEPDFTKVRVVDFDLKELVVLPPEIDLNEWLASNTLTFFNLINLQYSTVSEFCTGDTCSVMSACNTTYYWYDEKGKKTRCTAPQYVDFVMMLCAVGVETLQTDFYSLAVYLLVASAGITLFEFTYFIDAFLPTWLMCPGSSKFSVIWKKMVYVGGFQKFLYYTVLSVMCFLHPVLVWHAVIPGTMLLLTGLFNLILSKRKKTSPPKGSRAFDGGLSVHVTESEAPKQTFSFFHTLSGKRVSNLPTIINSSEAVLRTDLSDQNLHNPLRKTDHRNVYFTKSFKVYEPEPDMEMFDMDTEETTSDKAPMISM